MAREVRLTMRLIDQVSGPGRAIQGALRGVNAAASSLSSMAMAPARAVGQMSRAARRSAGEMTVMSAGIGMGVAGVAKDIYKMEKALNVSVAAGGLDMRQRNEFMGEAIRLNAEYAATASEIVDAGNMILRAGFNYDQMMGSLPGILSTAQAMGVPMEDASTAVVDSMVSMRMAMHDTQSTMESSIRTADLYATAVNATTGQLDDFATSSKYFNPVAASMGLSPDETMAYQMALAKNGIKGSSAGTGLRASPVRIAAPSDKAMGAMSRLGIDPMQFMGSRTGEATGFGLAAMLESYGFTPDGLEEQIDKMIADPAFKNAPVKLANAILDQFGDEMGIATSDDRSSLANALQRGIMAGSNEVDLIGFLRAMKDADAGMADYATIFGLHHASKMQALDPAIFDQMMELIRTKSVGASKTMREAMMAGVIGDVAEFTAAVEKTSIMVGKSGLLADGAAAIARIAAELDRMADSSPALLRFGAYAAIALAAMAPMGFALAGIAGTLAFMMNPLVIAAGAFAAMGVVNWRAISNGLRTFGAFFRQGLSSSTVARLGQMKDSIAGMFSGGSAMRFNVMASRIGTGLANIVNAVAAYDFGPRLRSMAAAIGEMASSRVDMLVDVGRAFGDLADRAGPFFDAAFQSTVRAAGPALDSVGSALQIIAGVGSQAGEGVSHFFRAFAAGINDETLGILGRGANSLLSDFARDLQNLNTELQGYNTWVRGLDVSWLSGFGGDAARGFNQLVLEFSQMPDKINAEITRYKTYLAGMAAYVPSFGGIIGAIDTLVGKINSIVTAVSNAIAALARLPTDIGMIGRSFDNSGTSPAGDPLGNLPAQTVPGRWSGGPMRRGHVYRINERGQELFAPGRNGHMIPNHRLGGGGASQPIVVHTHVNVDGKEVARSVNRHNAVGSNRQKQAAFDRPRN